MQGGTREQRKLEEEQELREALMDVDNPEEQPVHIPQLTVVNQLSIQDLEEVYYQARHSKGIWSKYTIFAYNSEQDMQNGQNCVWSHSYGPVKADGNNKHDSRYTFYAAGLRLNASLGTKSLQAANRKYLSSGNRRLLTAEQIAKDERQDKIFKATLQEFSVSKVERDEAIQLFTQQAVSFREREKSLEFLIAATEAEPGIKVQEKNGTIQLSSALQEFWSSAGDSEVALLDDLYHTFQGDEQLTGFLNMHRQRQQVAHIRVIISGNMGPCLRCQERIRALVQDLQAYASTWGCAIKLYLDVNYTTPYNEENREAYGYNPKDYPVQEIQVPQGNEPWSYWSVSFKRHLGPGEPDDGGAVLVG